MGGSLLCVREKKRKTLFTVFAWSWANKWIFHWVYVLYAFSVFYFGNPQTPLLYEKKQMYCSWQFSEENIYLLLSSLHLFNHRNLAYFEQLFMLPCFSILTREQLTFPAWAYKKLSQVYAISGSLPVLKMYKFSF